MKTPPARDVGTTVSTTQSFIMRNVDRKQTKKCTEKIYEVSS